MNLIAQKHIEQQFSQGCVVVYDVTWLMLPGEENKHDTWRDAGGEARVGAPAQAQLQPQRRADAV